MMINRESISVEIKVTDGLAAYDELTYYKVQAGCEDYAVFVAPCDDVRAKFILKLAGLLVGEKDD